MKTTEDKDAEVPSTPALTTLAITAEIASVKLNSVSVNVASTIPTSVRCTAVAAGKYRKYNAQSPLTAVKKSVTVTLGGLKPHTSYKVMCFAQGVQSSPLIITTIARTRRRAVSPVALLTIEDMKLTQNGVLSFVVDSNLPGAVQCSVKNATSVQGTTRVRLVKARNVVNKRRMIFTDVNPKESVLGCSLLDAHNKGTGRGRR